MEPPSSIDPPEEMLELPPRVSSFPSSYHNNNIPPRGRHNNLHDYDDDDDEFELEGLVMTSNSCSRPPSFSSSVGVGSGGSRIRSTAQRTHRRRFRNCSPLMPLCSLAWNPQNRIRSAIVLLFRYIRRQGPVAIAVFALERQEKQT